MKLKIWTIPNCPACKMTNNLAQSLHIDTDVTTLHSDSKADQAMIPVLKKVYHVQQMPFVQVYDGDKVIDHWTGFHPEKIKQYK